MTPGNTNGDHSPPGGAPAPTSDPSPLDKLDETSSIDERLATLIEWARHLERSRIEDRNLRDVQYDNTLRTMTTEGERTRAIERHVAEQFGHLASALLTLGDAVTGMRGDLAMMQASFVKDRLERDEERAVLMRELGTRAKADSIHDEALDQQGGALVDHQDEITETRAAIVAQGKTIAAQQTALEHLRGLATWQNAGKGGTGLLALVKLVELLHVSDVLGQIRLLLP